MSIAYYSQSVSTDVREILDANLRPICLIQANETLRQGLLHRRVSVLVTNDKRQCLLAETASKKLGFTAQAQLPAGESKEDIGNQLIIDIFGQAPKLHFLLEVPPNPQSGNVLEYIFEARFSRAMLAALKKPDFLLTDFFDLPWLNSEGQLEATLQRVLLLKPEIFKVAKTKSL